MQRVIGFCLAVVIAGAAAPAHGQAYFQQSVHYTMDVRLDNDSRHLTGGETIEYTNNSPDTLSELYLHLYPNAYRSKDSEFMRHYRRAYNLTLFDLPESRRSYIEMTNVTVDGSPVTPRVDDTIARIALPAPLLPGATLTLKLDFDHKVRRHLGRAGYEGNHYDFAQWYPKVVVYDEKGFHSQPWRAGEFYGEFGTYDVRITVPGDFVVAATGTVQEGDPGWTQNSTRGGAGAAKGSTRTVLFHAEDVHDFAWSTDPTFVVQDTTWNDIRILSFYRKKDAGTWADSTLAHGVRAMQWLDERVGRYAYPQISIVDALLGGGMEYPMLVMDGSASEGLVVHEVGHNYFYGILANDEVAEAWLDEGFTTFQTQWYMNERYGPWGSRKDWNFYRRMTPQSTLWQNFRSDVFRLDRRHYGERISTRAEDFENSYREAVYHKAALMLRALRYVVGDETFQKILHEYYNRWKLRHVDEARFRQVAEEVSGMDLGLFFEEWLHTRKTCDYRLERVVTRPDENGGYEVGIVVEREGEMVMPVTIHFTLEDGSVVEERVDGKLRTIKQKFTLPGKPKRTALVPGNEISDIDFADNFQPRRKSLQFDWPNNDYHPEDAYQIRYRPGAWYNDVDGLKAGLLLRGSYYGWSRRVRLGVYYGAESDRLDFTISWDRPLYLFGNNGLFHASGYKMEGRQDFTTTVEMSRRPELSRPPTQRYLLGFNYHKLANPRYLNSTEIYDTTRLDLGPFIGYSIDPQLDVASTSLSSELRFGREWFGGDYKYERFTSEALVKSRTQFTKVDIRARVFLGLLGGSSPKQEKFNLAGAGPLAAERHYWLRSPGAAWKDMNYLEPGDGNLRGYQAGTFGVNRLLALNTEIGTRVPLFGLQRLVGKLAGRVSWAAFYDWGRVFDDNNPIRSSSRIGRLFDRGSLDGAVMDAGVGFRAHRNFPFYDMTLRVDLPFWVSAPEINGESDETMHRYVISLSGTF